MVAPKKSKGKSVEKSVVPPSSPDKESLVGSTIPIKKGSAISVPSGTMYDRTRSKRKAAETGPGMTEVDEGVVEG